MKKYYLAFLIACTIGGSVHAQISAGGFPWSMVENSRLVPLSAYNLPEPDYEQLKREDELDAVLNVAKPYRIAATINTEINTKSHGNWSYLADGRKVWRLAISVPGAKALSFNYNRFELPEGVSFFLRNQSGKQVLGAYTSANNSEFGVFAHEQVMGDQAILELNFEAGVTERFEFNIDKIWAAYRGVQNIYETDDVALRPTNAESPCHINASCPEGDGALFAKAKAATVQINMGGSVCSGTMINSTANAESGVCKPYLLTASHCDGANSYEDAGFANWVFTFNYQWLNCDGSNADEPRSRTGARFRARSHNPSMGNPGENRLVSDFLLLELNSPPQAAANAYLVGWNRDQYIDSDPEYYTKFVGFHHPGGDRKKLGVSFSIDGTETFNQSVVSNTHWKANFTVGGTEGGSSGSGLFDIDGLLIGDLSGGPKLPGDCFPMGKSSLYSKLSYMWENEFDQQNFPQYAGAASRVKDWLAPGEPDRIKMESVKYDCSDYNEVVSVKELATILNTSFTVYPNPASDVLHFKANFPEQRDVNIAVYDITGSKKQSFDLKNVRTGNYKTSVENLASGMYFVTISSNGVSVSKKIVVQK
jgi:lysyl endopeptidase